MKLTSLWSKITNNLPAKILSIALALLLYLSHQMLSLETKKFAIPISMQETGDMVITNLIPEAIQVRLRSTSANVSSILPSDIQIQLDTRHYFNAGKYTIPLQVIVSPKLIVMDTLEIEISPKSIPVYLEKRVAKWVELTPVFTGECADGYTVSKVRFEPEMVQISGASASIDMVETLHVDKIILTDKQHSFQSEALVRNFSNAIDVSLPEEIIVSVTIDPIYKSHVFNNIRVQTTGLSQTLVLGNTLPAISVELYGTKHDLESYKPALIDVQADFSYIVEAGKYEVPLRVFLPNRFEMKNVEPAKVSVVILDSSEVDNNEKADNIE
ncbi:MAG TPA: CdaR family protein [Treponemataceae bacterium]|nr:CdaR family protein [Treponemataceae bacterium]